MSAVEDVATAIAEQVREKGWRIYQNDYELSFWHGNDLVAHLYCDGYAQARRLAEMMSGPPPRSVFDAMGIDPVDPLERFPSIRSKA